MPQHWDLDKGSGHIHRSKKPKSHQSPGGLEEASTHNQNNEYFEVTYERQASKSGVQQKKENKKEISIGTILPGRQISQCLCRSFQFHTQTSTGTPLGRMDFPVVTIPQDCPAPSACAKCSQWAVKQLQGSSSSVAAFRLECNRIFAHVSFYTSECLIHWEEVGTHIFPPSGQKCYPAAIQKAPGKVSSCF